VIILTGDLVSTPLSAGRITSKPIYIGHNKKLEENILDKNANKKIEF
jgi:hypothetical protein